MRPPEGCPLSQPEWEVSLATFAGGKVRRSREVGRRLYCTGSTVRTHLANARHKLGAADTEDLGRILVAHGWMGEQGGARVARGGNEAEELSPALKAYLAAFDDLLANWRDPEKVAHARHQMRHHLAGEVLGRRLPASLLRGSSRPTATRSIRGELDPVMLPGVV